LACVLRTWAALRGNVSVVGGSARRECTPPCLAEGRDVTLPDLSRRLRPLLGAVLYFTDRGRAHRPRQGREGEAHRALGRGVGDWLWDFPPRFSARICSTSVKAAGSRNTDWRCAPARRSARRTSAASNAGCGQPTWPTSTPWRSPWVCLRGACYTSPQRATPQATPAP